MNENKINWKELIIGILLMIICYLSIANNYYKAQIDRV